MVFGFLGYGSVTFWDPNGRSPSLQNVWAVRTRRRCHDAMAWDTARLHVAGNCPFSDSTRALARAVASKLVCMVACRVLMVERKHPDCSLFLSDFVFRPIPMTLSLSLSSVQGCCRIFSGSHSAAPLLVDLTCFNFSIA